MNRATRSARITALALTGFCWGCAGNDAQAGGAGTFPAGTEPSGAAGGVPVVRHDDPVDRADVPTWTVETEPALVVGAGDEDGFGLVAGAVWLGDGTIAAADAHARHVRLFAPDGAVRGTAGRRGGGPGEFESVDAIWPVGTDSLGLFDVRMMRITVMGPDGEVGRTTPLELTGVKAHPMPLATLDDGTILAVSDGRTFREDVETYRSDLSLLAYAPDGSIDRTIAEIPGDQMWNLVWDMGVTPSPIPFGRPTVVASDGDVLWVGANEGYALERYELDGSISLRIRLDREARALDPGRVERYRAEERAKAESPGAAAKGPGEIYTLLAESAPYPEVLPAYDAILPDDGGRLWVRDYAADPSVESSWTVFTREGDLVATARLPARFRPTAIRDGRLLGVWTDQLDVEQVRVYELRSPGPGRRSRADSP